MQLSRSPSLCVATLLTTALAGWSTPARSEGGAGGVDRGPAAAASSVAHALDPHSEVKLPTDWLPAHGRECARTGKRKGFCQGPRRVPRPQGPDAELAEKLGLGTLETAGTLLGAAPRPEWTQAAGPDRSEKLLWPVADGLLWRGLERGHRTQEKWHPRHKGLDIGAPDGTRIRAVKSGIVAYSDNGVGGYGNLLITVQADGSVALYGHCQAIYVFAGQRVEQGQIVAEVGHTGVARGPHLHFEYRTGGRIRNPLKYFSEPVSMRGMHRPGV